MLMKDNINLIIGGTSGLGFEIAKNLRAKGETCFVVGRTYDPEKHGDGCTLDLSDRNLVREFISTQPEMLQAVGAVYWVAGKVYIGDFADQENIEQMIDVNVTNALPIIQNAWKALLERNEGRVVVIASTAGVKARADEAVYALTKHAQVGFARSLGLEAQRLNGDVKVFLALPGGMKTPFWDGMQPASYDSFNDPARVAERIVEAVMNQTSSFHELAIERGEAL
jgi:3-oxoacyl-[acyl-carrier protein] reductase